MKYTDVTCLDAVQGRTEYRSEAHSKVRRARNGGSDAEMRQTRKICTHLLFWVRDNKLSEKFYKKIGFVIEKSDDQMSVVKLGDLMIELITMRDEEEFGRDSMNPTNWGVGVYFYLRSDDVDAEYEKLCKLKLNVATKPRDWPWGRREFILKDPDGYKFCIWQPSRWTHSW